MRMHKGFMLMAMAMVVLNLAACRAPGSFALGGAAIGGALGGVGPQLFSKSPSRATTIIAPLAATIVGGGIGYMIDSNQAEKAEQEAAHAAAIQQAQQQQAAAQQQQMYGQIAAQSAASQLRLSVPIVVVTGPQSAVLCQTGTQLYTAIQNVPHGSAFGVVVKTKNLRALQSDMAANGMRQVGSIARQGDKSSMKFQRGETGNRQMSPQQAMNLL